MRLTIQDSPQIRRVTVLGQVEPDCEHELLMQIDSAPTSQTLELDFYDAEQLPAAVFEAIDRRLAAAEKLKIIVYRDLLAHMLARLQLPFRKASAQPAITPLPVCKALAIAGSANSLDKMQHIISRLPEAEVAVFVVQHVLETQTNLLDQLLQVMTNYRVIMPHHLMPVEAGTIYVAPPGHHLRVAHGLVYLTRDRKIQFARPSIDALFESVAAEYGPNALAVLLCGFGQDGVQGCAALKAAGSCVLIENSAECEEAGVLPQHAQKAGQFDHVLSCAALASVVAAAVIGPQAAPAGGLLRCFLQAIKADYGYDLQGYQQDSFERRIKNMMISFGVHSFCDFQRLVFSNATLFQRLIAEMSVGVSSFFRHPEQFQLLRAEILPYLASFPLIKVWSAGCSSGEEAYSLAIMLHELGLLSQSRIFATDINPYLLALAQLRLFANDTLAVSRRHYLAAGGAGRFDDYVQAYSHFFKLNDAQAKPVWFHQHSLVQDGVFNEFGLIVCRNVLIYLDEQAQQRALRCFADSLHPDGFLVLGPQDGLQQAARTAGFEPYRSSAHVYKLAAGSRRV